MTNTEPAPITEYFIAYMDLLGYKSFFQESPEKVPEFLADIHAAIQDTQDYINNLNLSTILSTLNTEFKVRVFSDNILICLEAVNDVQDQLRLMVLVKLVGDIQRKFIVQYGLFLRGGIAKGPLSFNENYVFGQGLIDVVAMEGKAKYPRIIISDTLISFMNAMPAFLSEGLEKACNLIDKLKRNDSITEEENQFLKNYKSVTEFASMIAQFVNLNTLRWQDGFFCLSYLCGMISPGLPQSIDPAKLLNIIRDHFPSDYIFAISRGEDVDETLKTHKKRVEEKLAQYGNYNGITNEACIPKRLSVMQKYIWSMTYHNLVCRYLNKPDFIICTRANFNAQFVMPTIEVIPDEPETRGNDSVSSEGDASGGAE